MRRYSCDFETTTDIFDCRVWLWVAIDIDNTDSRYFGNSIETFYDFLCSHEGTYYFHNAGFDCEFLLYYLLSHGYSHTKERKLLPYQLTTLIGPQGQFYTMSLKTPTTKIKIIDSLKIIPFKVEKIAKDLKLPIQKLEIDYHETRKPGHISTQDEKDYITNDALIVALALKQFFQEGFTKITAGSNAFNNFLETMGGKKKFRNIFPVQQNDAYIRKSYFGGWVYVNPKFQGQTVGEGIALDANSLYPFVLHSPYKYPIGCGIYFEGKYVPDKHYDVYFQRVTVALELKEGMLPTIQNRRFSKFCITPEYVTTTNGKEVELTLTMMDLELMQQHYDCINMTYIDGYKYRSKTGMFDEFIDFWYQKKAEAKQQKNDFWYFLSKLNMNSFSGKMATTPTTQRKIPTLVEKTFRVPEVAYNTETDTWESRLSEPITQTVLNYKGETEVVNGKEQPVIEEKEPIYIPVGSFFTSYARCYTINAAQANIERFLYSDTDSVKLLGTEPPVGMELHDSKLGAFKLEETFSEACFLRAKMYREKIIETVIENGVEKHVEKFKITGAGMPASCHKYVTPDNFKIGQSFPGKLKPIHVAGGIVLREILFTIREQ